MLYYTLFIGMAVEYEVLRHEDEVGNHRYIGKSKLHRISEEAGPVCLQGTVDDQLSKAEDTATEIQEYLSN